MAVALCFQNQVRRGYDHQGRARVPPLKPKHGSVVVSAEKHFRLVLPCQCYTINVISCRIIQSTMNSFAPVFVCDL